MSRQVIRKQHWLRAAALLAAMQAGALGLTVPNRTIAAAQQNARSEKRVTLNVSRGDVEDVIKALSIQSGEDIIVLPSIKGSVTIRLTNVPLDEALRKVAASVTGETRRIEGTYFLGSLTELRAVVARTGYKETVATVYAKAEEVKDLLQAAFPFLTVDAIAKTNMLVLTGAKADIEGARTRIREVDVAPAAEPPKPLLVVKDSRRLKFMTPDVAQKTVLAAVNGVKTETVEKTIIVEGQADAVAQAVKLVDTLDVQGASERVVRTYKVKFVHPQQASATLTAFFPGLTVQAGTESYVPNRATFAPLGIETERAFSAQGLNGGGGGGAAGGAGGAGAVGGSGGAGGAGGAGGGAGAVVLGGPGSRSRVIILSGHPGQVQEAIKLIEELDVAPDQVLIEARVVDLAPSRLHDLGFRYQFNGFSLSETRNPGASITQFGNYARGPFNIETLFSAQDTVTDFKVLARPNITVVDGEEASIFIGDIVRYERLSSVTDTGQQLFTIESVPVGVALLCRPRVNTDDGKITLRLHPVVSSITAFTGSRNDIPQTATREAESTLVLKDGETFAIGGLLRDEDIKTFTSVPFLSKIPFLGEMFKHRRTSKRKSEVTIFMTVKRLKG
jgi:type II secretory pathway component GspD/PulD (secretin)